MTRKAEVVTIGGRARWTRLAAHARPPARPTSGVRRGSSGKAELGRAELARGEVFAARRLLLEDDTFDRVRTDAELDALVADASRRSKAPYSDILRRMLGMEHLDEAEARDFFRRVLDHRRRMARALGRDVHFRVAGLDLLSVTPPSAGVKHDSRPIVVTPQLLEKALEEASADAVTGLPQRAHFMSILRHETRQRRRRSVAVAFIDLDGFKEVNDTYGHARGDDILRVVARAGKTVLREGDVLARIGGDEFAVMLVDASPEEAYAAMERFRARFESRTGPLGTSFSVGIVLAEPGETADEVLTRADEAMYRDKRARAAARATPAARG